MPCWSIESVEDPIVPPLPTSTVAEPELPTISILMPRPAPVRLAAPVAPGLLEGRAPR